MLFYYDFMFGERKEMEDIMISVMEECDYVEIYESKRSKIVNIFSGFVLLLFINFRMMFYV